MIKFHRRCGDRVTLLNHNLTAIRNFVEFNHGLILSADPLVDDVLFEVRIDRKVNVWNGSLEIGVTTLDPEFMELPATATKLRNTAWILSGSSIVKDGVTIVNSYGPELDSLREGDTIGVIKTSKGELMFFVNGRCLGIAARDLPPRLFAVIDLYGQCVQVSVIHGNYTRPMIDTYDQIQEYGVGTSQEAGPSEAQAGSSADPKVPTVSYITVPILCPLVSQDHLRFHPRCGILVKLSSNNKTAERARPLDDYNNGVVMTHRPLYDNELFEIRIERLVDKWSGSIEVGVTSHNPATIRFPSTMTNMDSGTIMMSGCKVLLNGHGTCMEYGNFNLDELREGDTVGMMRKSNGKLHYFINGIDQGVATDKVPPQVWGVIDLYGMTVKVNIVDPCEDIDSNMHHLPIRMLSAPEIPTPNTFRSQISEEMLLFHTLRDSNVIIINDGKTAHRPNAFEFFNNGIVMTNRTLKTNELFQVRLDLVIPKWAGSIEIGVTVHSSNDIKFPFRMSNAKTGTWAVTGEDVIRDGNVIIPQYVRNLSRLVEGDTVGVMRKDMGILHFYVNGIDQGPAAFNIPEHVFGIVDLYGRVAQATIVDMYAPPQAYSPESPVSTESNATVYPEMCFHRVHGRNARLSRNRLTASRATVYSEFNDAVLFSSRPLRECDMFEVRIDKMVDCWIGSLEIGVTAIRPDDLEANGGVGAIAGTATDLSWDTYILSGAAMMKDGECVRSGYPLDLDTLTVGSRVGMMWHADRSLHYYLDGMDMGKAWYVPHLNIYAVIDLYGQCTQVTILQNEERAFNYNGCNSDHAILGNPRVTTPPPPYWSFSEYFGENISLSKDYCTATRLAKDPMGAIVFSSTHLIVGEMFEIKILECKDAFAGSFRMGVTDTNILNANVNRNMPLSVSWLTHYTAYVDGKYLKYSKPCTEEQDLRSFVPSFEWLRAGDRVGLKKTNDSRVLIYFNSEPLELAIENVPDKVYVVMEMYGNISKIQTVSRGTNVTATNQQTIPNDNMADQKSQQQQNVETSAPVEVASTAAAAADSNLESNTQPETSNAPAGTSHTQAGTSNAQAGTSNAQAGPSNAQAGTSNAQAGTSNAHGGNSTTEALDTVHNLIDDTNNVAGPSNVSREQEIMCTGSRAEVLRRNRSLPYTFHYIHGRNIRLCSSETVALRFKGHSHGIAVASQPLRRGHHFRFRVDKVSNEWQGTASVGAVTLLPTEIPPRSAFHIDSPCWIMSNDVLYNKGVYTYSEVGRSLEELAVNSVLSLYFLFNNELVLEVDGRLRGTIAVVPRKYFQVYPLIDLYGKIIQVSILLHPHPMPCGQSLDLPLIPESTDEGWSDDPDNAGYDPTPSPHYSGGGGDYYTQQNTRHVNETRSVMPSTSTGHGYTPSAAALSPQPGPSTHPDVHTFFFANKSNDAKNRIIQCRYPVSFSLSVHQSMIMFDEPDRMDNDEAAKAKGLKKSHSSQECAQAVVVDSDDDEDEDSQSSLINPLSLGSRMGFDDDTDEEDVCDTNIRHNDRFPEASDVDNLDSEIMVALTMETGNLPDLTEEQSPSIDESTRRDDWGDGLVVENLHYLNEIICWTPDFTTPRFADRDWVFISETNGNCEHMHLALKFWNQFVHPFTIMTEVVASGQVRCFCINCLTDLESPFSGWVRIERTNPGTPNRMYWHIVRSTLVAAQTMTNQRGVPRRPDSILALPSTSTNTSEVWYDEEGKPHNAVLALDIDVRGPNPGDDRLLAYMIFLRPPAQVPVVEPETLSED